MKLVYNKLLDSYGPQGWWPLVSRAGDRGFDDFGYHHGNYDYPITTNEIFEIAIGAVLTQNTAWLNVEKAITNLLEAGLLNPEKIYEESSDRLAKLIRPSGYYNEKAKKIKNLAAFFIKENIVKTGSMPSRDKLLGIWGIGFETADSILLYGFKYPIFVVDAYTRRLVMRLGSTADYSVDSKSGLSYENLRSYLERSLGNDFKDYRIYNEFHALIVEHAKRHCRVKKLCMDCPLADICRSGN